MEQPSNGDESLPGRIIKSAWEVVFFIGLYLVCSSPLYLTPVLFQPSKAVSLLLIYCAGALVTPFVVLPCSRYLTKAMFGLMRIVNDLRWRKRGGKCNYSDGQGFVRQLERGNVAVSLIRVSFVVGLGILIARTIVPWAGRVQDILLYETKARPLGVGQVIEMVFVLLASILCALGISLALVAINVVLLINVTTWRINDYEQVHARGNVAVAMMYAALTLITFLVAGEACPRVVAAFVTK